MRSSRLTNATAALVAAVVLAGCGSAAAKRGNALVVHDVGFGITTYDADRFKTLVIGSLTVCVDGEPVRLEKIEPIEVVGSARIVRVGAREVIEGKDSIASMPGPLPSRYSPLAGYNVDTRCEEDSQRTTEIAIEVASPPKDANSAIFGLRVTYRSGDARRTVAWSKAEFLLCNVETSIDRLRDCAEEPEYVE